jgi:hypothetical protein
VYYRFGKTFEDTPTKSFLDEVDHYLQTAPAVSHITAKLVLREMYEKAFGIHDHADARISPLKLVTLHKKENVSEYSDLYNRHRRYILLDMYKHTGLSVTEFFNQPLELVDLHFRIVSDDSARRLKEPDPLKGLDK